MPSTFLSNTLIFITLDVIFKLQKTLDCAKATKTIVCSNYSGVIIFISPAVCELNSGISL